MIGTPYRFEHNFSAEDFQKIGRFALRWSHIDHTIGNCLRRLLDLDPKPATVMVFPLTLDMRMRRIQELSKIQPLTDKSRALFDELQPLVRAMQFIRNTALHGIIIDLAPDDEPFFELRTKNRKVTKADLLGCEDLINYTAHVSTAFRFTLGEKGDELDGNYTLPDRPPIPDFLPNDCRSFPLKEAKAKTESRPKPSP